MIDAIIILIVAVIAYVWSTRGALSSFLHLLCTIAAGAIAFAVWEPLALVLLNTGEEMAADFAWGVSLGVPFVLLLVVFRVVVDKLVPANVEVDTTTNFVGGAVFGAAAGILTAGLALLSIGYSRGPTSYSGYRPVQYDNSGSLVVKSGLVLPVEVWTSKFYSAVSGGLFRPVGGESLARLHPDLAYEGALLRTNFEDGKSRISLPPATFEVVTRYTYAPTDPKQLLTDTFDSKRVQAFSSLDGTSVNVGASQIEGVAVKFKAGAKERSGGVIVGAGQMRLIVQTNANDPDSPTIGVQPLAVVALSADPQPRYSRWRFDAADTYFRSVGGADEAPMAFEFVTPKGSKPIAIMVKGVRVNLGDMKSQSFTAMTQRDDAIRSGSITRAGVTKLDQSEAVTVKYNANDQSASKFIDITTIVPFNAVLQKDIMKGLTLGGEKGNEIDGGELSKFSDVEIKAGGSASRELQVRNFAKTDDTTIVVLVVDRRNAQYGLLSDPAAGVDRSKPPILVDSTGTPYSPVGFVYKASGETWIQFSPQSPVASLDSMGVSLSKSRTDQQLVLIYRVSRGAQIQSFAVGEKVIANFTPAVATQR